MTILQKLEQDLGHRVSAGREGDYQCNVAFSLAKESGRKPIDVANEIAAKFKSDIATVSVSGAGFLNFHIKDDALSHFGQEIMKTGRLSMPVVDKKTFMFDYGAPNIGKELHVGHLRSPIIGEALKRVAEALGHKTIADNYLGDWGLPMGLILAELELAGRIVDGKLVGEVTLDTLNEFYPRASVRKSEDPEFKMRAEQITIRIQSHSKPWHELWKQIRAVSVAKIKENYDLMGCTFDTYNGESYSWKYVATVLAHLQEQGLTYMDKDCLLMDVKEDTDTGPMPPVILKKGNGGDLYATSDIATIWYRHHDYAPDEFIYVVDQRQSLHFNQLFRVVKKGGIVPESTKLTHVGYGTINGTDGKPFKTRAGGTIKLEEVFNILTDAAKKRLQESGRNVDDETARKIGLAALKFADLQNTIRKDYQLDIDKFTSFEGKTGPYLLYTIARINSILGKGDLTLPEVVNVSDVTRPIFIAMLRLVDSFATALQNYTLNGIVDAVFNLSQEFNNFYATTNILREADASKRNSYLVLCQIVKNAITFALDKLAIETVDKM